MTTKVDTATLMADAAALRKPRHKTREVRVGNLVIGGDNPILVQSMTTPDTYKVEETVAEILRLEEAGCEMVRVTVPKPEDAAVLSEIKKRIHIPLICDIHFDYKMALAALDHPVDKIRINPGNIGGYDRYRQVIRKAKAKGMPMRIGVNAGSLERELVEKHGYPCPSAMVEIAPALHRNRRVGRLSRPHRVAEIERCHHGGRSVSAVRQVRRLSDAHRHHRGGQGALRRDEIGVRPGPDPARRHRRHDSHFAAGRSGPRNRGGVRHSASDAAPRAQAGADRLSDVRPAGDRPGSHHRPDGRAARRAARRR